jgi:hypothetical protein
MRPLNIVDDPEFHCLMKTGRPHLRIPSPQTVARDVHTVFRNVKDRIVKILRVSSFGSPGDPTQSQTHLTARTTMAN